MSGPTPTFSQAALITIASTRWAALVSPWGPPSRSLSRLRASRVVDLDLPDAGPFALGIEAALDVAGFERVPGTGREQELVAFAADADLWPFRGAAFGLELPREPHGRERNRGQRQGFDAAVCLAQGVDDVLYFPPGFDPGSAGNTNNRSSHHGMAIAHIQA